MIKEEIRQIISEKGLKVTPQRVAILEAVIQLHNHPTAENVAEYIRPHFPHIAVGTIYKVLDTFVAHNLLKKVKTDTGVMRYDEVNYNHHHLYCTETQRIEDYEDDVLSQLIQNYFKNKKIKNFKIEDIRLQITGKFQTPAP